MSTRANYMKLAPQATQALFALEKALGESSIDHGLRDLVKIRVSQINGCLFCLDMHSKEAKKNSERELRLYHLPVWRESPLFNEKEKAALEWTELLTQFNSHGASDEEYAKVSAQFSEKEIADLTLIIASINAWNRLGVAFRPVPGTMDKVMGLAEVGLQ